MNGSCGGQTQPVQWPASDTTSGDAGGRRVPPIMDCRAQALPGWSVGLRCRQANGRDSVFWIHQAVA